MTRPGTAAGSAMRQLREVEIDDQGARLSREYDRSDAGAGGL
jgi:hypothetical protein